MEKKYKLSYDILTIIACLMVVFFHMNDVFYAYSDTISWKISVVERCIVYSAIPIFFMLSGAKLMTYRNHYSTKDYIKKRLLRVGIPFLFWNIIYIIYGIVMPQVDSFHSVKEFISMLLNSQFQERYWFFFPLFAVYAAIPVVSLLLQVQNHRKYLWFTVYLSFLLHWVLPPVLGVLGIRFNSDLIMPVCGGYLMYAIFGYLISTEEWSRTKRITLYVLALASGIFAVYYTLRVSQFAGETQLYMVAYDHFPSALTGAAIFVFIKHLFDKPLQAACLQENSKLVKFIHTLSGTCMGIWLTHSFGILVVAFLTDISVHSYLWRFVFPPVVFAVCALGTYIAKKIPFIKHVV